jgi:hypothetical protein
MITQGRVLGEILRTDEQGLIADWPAQQTTAAAMM